MGNHAMIGALTVLLAFQLVGEILVQISGLPAPGPVIGMVLLLLTLYWRGALPDPGAVASTDRTALGEGVALYHDCPLGEVVSVDNVDNLTIITEINGRHADQWSTADLKRSAAELMQ